MFRLEGEKSKTIVSNLTISEFNESDIYFETNIYDKTEKEELMLLLRNYRGTGITIVDNTTNTKIDSLLYRVTSVSTSFINGNLIIKLRETRGF